MTTPYPFVSTGVSTAVSTAVSSSTSSEAASDSSPSSLSSHTSSDSSDTIRPYKHNVLKPASPAQLIEPESNHQLLPPKAIDVPRQVSRPSLKHPHEDIRLARHRLLSRNDPVLEPRFPTRRNDFPGKPAQGDPNTTNKSEYSPVDGPRWSDEEYYGVLAAALARKYPPDLDGMAAARARNAPLFSKRQHHLAVAENDVSITTTANNTATTTAAGAPPRPLQGFFHTLDLLKEIKRGNRAEFGAWSAARGRLEEGLADRAGRLQADFAAHVERVWRAQHARRHGRVSDGEYQAAKRRHMDEMRGLLRAAHDVAIAMGVLYAERAAVAQGAVPRHGENWGKLDLVCIFGGPELALIHIASHLQSTCLLAFVPSTPPSTPFPFQTTLPDGIARSRKHEGHRKAHDFIVPPPPTPSIFHVCDRT